MVFRRPRIQLPTFPHTPPQLRTSNRIPSPSPSSLKGQVQPLDLMSTSEFPLQQVLDDHFHLNLTPNIAKNGSTQVGGGGFSDVFRSRMRKGWQPRNDTHILNLLNPDRIGFSSTGPAKRRKIGKKPICVVIAVKRLRFWDRSISKVEKVFFPFTSHIRYTCLNNHYRQLPRRLKYGQHCHTQTYCLS